MWASLLRTVISPLLFERIVSHILVGIIRDNSRSSSISAYLLF